jgi:hypothetical protein
VAAVQFESQTPHQAEMAQHHAHRARQYAESLVSVSADKTAEQSFARESRVRGWHGIATELEAVRCATGNYAMQKQSPVPQSEHNLA